VSRTVTLVLVDAAGELLGALPSVEAREPWWQSTADVAAAVQDRFGLDVTVLRLLRAERSAPPGGAVTYLAQVGERPQFELVPVSLRLPDHPARPPYARPGGPQSTLRWATAALRTQGLWPVVQAVQERTWNLSSLWRLETSAGVAWIKEVPEFFGHEPAILRWLTENGQGARVPPLLAAEGQRMLLGHVAGADLYGADVLVRDAIGAAMHEIHLAAADAVPQLLHIGLPDRRPAVLVETLPAVVATAGAVDPRLEALVAGLEDRLRRVEECGLPATLVHGDLHPGNARALAGGPIVLIDWGDSAVGHPALDMLRLIDGVAEPDARYLVEAWARRWRGSVPGCEPTLALELMKPVAALIAAAAYAGFLARIEPAEHPYHRSDVPACLARAAELACV